MSRKRRRTKVESSPATPRPPSRRWGVVVVVVLIAAVGVYVGGRQLARRAGTRLPGSRSAATPCNVLLVTLDTTRADYLACYGSTKAKTPHIDALARDGALFQRCQASSVQTLPSHATIMTGLYPHVHGVRRNATDQLVPSAVTLAERFKAAGYATAASIGSFVLDQRTGIAQGFDTYHGVAAPHRTVDPDAAERKGDQVCDDALSLLRSLAKQRFFLWVHFYDPHYPYESARVADRESPEAYADEIAFMDAQVGRLVDELGKLGLGDNTVVVLAGDHGEGLNDHDEYEHGYFVYQTTVHVPLIIRAPGGPAGVQVPGVVRLLDVAPTILDLVGLPPLEGAQGVTLRPLLSGKTTDLALVAYTEAFDAHTLFGLSRLWALTDGRWKYIHSSSPRLYDLAADPAEARDRLAEQPERAAQLRARLETLVAEAPPPLVGDTAAKLSDDEMARLESLGYVGTVRDPNASGASEADLFDPREPDPHTYVKVIGVYGRARDAMRRGELAPCEAAYREVIQALPAAPAALRDLAFVLAGQKRHDEARGLLEKALTLTPQDKHIRLQYASTLLAMQRWDEGFAQLREVLRQAPDDTAAHTMMGMELSRLQRWEEAREHLEAAVRAQPRNTTNLLMLGQAYHRLRMPAEAADCFRRVLAVEPNNERARGALHVVEQELGNK